MILRSNNLLCKANTHKAKKYTGVKKNVLVGADVGKVGGHFGELPNAKPAICDRAIAAYRKATEGILRVL